MISARCTRHRPVNATSSGCCAHHSRQRRGPLVGATDVEHLLAARDHAAVDDARDDRRELAGDRRDHRLVEQREPVPHAPVLHEHLALRVEREREQVGVAELLADLRGLRGRDRGSFEVPVRLVLEAERQQQIAVLDALVVLTLEQSLRTGEPPCAPRDLAANHERHPDPEGAAHGGEAIVRAQVRMVSALEEGVRLVVAAEHVRRGREPPQVVGRERCFAIGPFERPVRIAPRPPRIPLAAAVDELGRARAFFRCLLVARSGGVPGHARTLAVVVSRLR